MTFTALGSGSSRPISNDPTGSASRDHERGSMPLLMLVMLVGLMLAGLMTPMIVNQANTTRFDGTRSQELNAAQAGIDAALARIRGTKDASGYGQPKGLPCWSSSAPFVAPVDGTSSGSQLSLATYSVSINYYVDNPVTATSPLTPMVCSQGYGTYDKTTALYTPSFAQITSKGTVSSANGTADKSRTLVTTYRFKTDNNNIAGGIIRIYPASGSTQNLCMDAGSATPTDGTAITLQPCSTSTPPAAQQVFAYRSDLTIQLSSSVTTSNAVGLCLDTDSASNAALAAGQNIVLRACVTTAGQPKYQQTWSFNDNGHFQGSLSTSSATGNLSNFCINATAQTAGQTVNLATCAGSVSDPAQAWIPAPSAGAGAAALPQWINYKEFGRCLDVTGQNPNADHLIDYPCKQNPYANAVAWNQKLTYTAVTGSYGTMTTTSGTTVYCLTGVDTTSGTAPFYVTIKPCVTSASNPTVYALQMWRVYDGSTDLPYAQRNRIMMNSTYSATTQQCMGLTTPYGSEVWSALVVRPCDSGLDEKWNAAANLDDSNLLNTNEQ